MTDRGEPAPEQPFLLGIDVGTSGARAMLIDRLGNPRATAVARYGIDEPAPGWAEQDPTAWWDAVGSCVSRVLADASCSGGDVAAVGVTGQMHGLVLVDSSGRPLRPAIIWPDRRSDVQRRRIADEIGVDLVRRRSGQPVATGFLATSLLWVRDLEPELYREARWALLPKDYVRYRLTGVVATEPSDAAGSLLFDLSTGDWSAAMVSGLGLRRELLPPIQPSASSAGTLSGPAASATGLVAGTPVVAGAGDQASAAVSLDLGRPGRYAIGISTGGTVLAGIDAPTVGSARSLHTLASASPDRWLLMGAILSAGLSLDWLAHLFAGTTLESPVTTQVLDALVADAAGTPVGAGGLLFLPYLRGERTPHLDPSARGCFVGLTTEHTQAMLARAVMEGVAFALAESVALVADIAGKPNEIVCYGGGARGGEWCQILADVLGDEVLGTPGMHHSARGAAMLAGSSAMRSAIGAHAPREERYEPDGGAHREYEELRAIYGELYGALRPSFTALAERAARRTGM
jgi:xylulokinase